MSRNIKPRSGEVIGNVLSSMEDSRQFDIPTSRALGDVVLSLPDTDNYISQEELQAAFVDTCSGIASYVFNHDIPNVILNSYDRPLGDGAKEAWKQKYPSSTPPNFYIANHTNHPILSTWRKPSIQQYFPETYPELMQQQHQPLLVVDTQIDGVNTGIPLLRTLAELGFPHVRFAGLQEDMREAKERPYLMVVEDEPLASCYPFSYESLIESDFEVGKPQKKNDKNLSVRAARIRQEVSRLVLTSLQEQSF